MVGHMGELAREPIAFLDSLSTLGRVVRVDLGGIHAYVLTDADAAHQVLVEQYRKFEKGRGQEELRVVGAGNGMLVADNQSNRKQRRLIQPLFHKDRIARDFAPRLVEEIYRVTGSWISGQRLEFDQEAMRIVRGMFMRTILNEPAGSGLADDVWDAFDYDKSSAFMRLIAPESAIDRNRIAYFRRYLHSIVERIVKQRDLEKHEDTRNDCLTFLLNETDPDTGQPLDRDLVRDEVVGLLFAGTDSTGRSLAWAFHGVGQHPDVERKLHEEVDVVLEGRPVQFDDLPNLPYVAAVVEESLRLYGLLINTRKAVETVTIADVEMPAGTEVLFSHSALHRDPRVFAEPNRFNPDRWIVEKSEQSLHRNVMPYSKGPRTCLGAEFATVELRLSVASIAQQWSLQPINGQFVRPVPDTFLRPNMLPMTAVPRSK